MTFCLFYFKYDPFYAHLVSLFPKKIQNRCDICRGNRGKSFVKIYVSFITYKDSFTTMIPCVFAHELLYSPRWNL